MATAELNFEKLLLSMKELDNEQKMRLKGMIFNEWYNSSGKSIDIEVDKDY